MQQIFISKKLKATVPYITHEEVTPRDAADKFTCGVDK